MFEVAVQKWLLSVWRGQSSGTLGIRLVKLWNSTGAFYMLSKLSCIMSFGVIYLQLWLKNQTVV
jgi:hypothetical protein